MCHLNRLWPKNHQWSIERVKNSALEKRAQGRLVKLKHCAFILKNKLQMAFQTLEKSTLLLYDYIN